MIVAAGYLGNDANDAPAVALSGLDCTLVHVNRWLQETGDTHSTTVKNSTINKNAKQLIFLCPFLKIGFALD